MTAAGKTVSRHAAAIIWARQLAIRALKDEWRAQGLKPWDIEASELAKAAKDYLSEHPELIEQAAETVRNHPNYEHSLNGKNVSAREIADERSCTKYSKPNTAAIAQCGVSPKGVSDREGSGAVNRGCTQARAAQWPPRRGSDPPRLSSWLPSG